MENLNIPGDVKPLTSEFWALLDQIGEDDDVIDLTDDIIDTMPSDGSIDTHSSDGSIDTMSSEGSIDSEPGTQLSADDEYVPMLSSDYDSDSEFLYFNLNSKRTNIYMDVNNELKDQIIDMSRQIEHDTAKIQKLQEENDVLRSYVK